MSLEEFHEYLAKKTDELLTNTISKPDFVNEVGLTVIAMIEEWRREL